MGQIDATFQGHHADAGAGVSFSLSLGPTPDVNVINMIGTETTWSPGSVAISDGTTTITVTNLQPFAWQVRNGRDGQYTEIQVRDSRQNWIKRGVIYGEYNKPFADGSENQQQNAQQLVTLCLNALQETGYNVSALPTDFYPYVRWEAAKPGAEATAICQMCNCALGLQSSGNAKVFKLGSGASLPSGAKEKNDLGQQKLDRPDVYLVRGAQNICQITSTLVPVGLDTDGSVKPLESVSYYAAAVAAWGSIGAAIRAGFAHWMDADGSYSPTSGYTGPVTYAAACACATKSCGCWFQIPATQKIFLPALPTICETYMEQTSGKAEWKKPYLLQVGSPQFFDKQTQQWKQLSTINNSAWELDEKRGIVKLTEGCVLNADDSIIGVQLVWAYHELHSDGTLQQDNFYSAQQITGDSDDPDEGSNPTVEVIPADWLQLRKIVTPAGDTVPTDSDSGDTPDTVDTDDFLDDGADLSDEDQGDDSSGSGDTTTVLNQTELDAVAKKIIQYYDPGNEFVSCGENTYPGLVTIWPDGCIRKVTWHAGADGSYTTVVYNTERPPIGGARLERKIEGLKKDWQVKDSASMAYKSRLAGFTIPQSAHVGSHDRSGMQQVRPEARRDLNNSGQDAPYGGILWTNQGNDATTGLPGFIQPLFMTSEIDIAAGIIPAGMSGLAVHVGRPMVLLAPGLTVTPGQRLGPTPGQWYASQFDLAPMTAKRMVSINGTNYAEVDLHRQMGDVIYVNGTPYKAVICGEEITLAAGSVAGDFIGTR